MSTIPDFTGFPAEGIQWLRDIAENNNKDWFEANRKTYKKMVQAPAQSLVQTLGTRLQTIDEQIRFDTRSNGSGSLLRINRDVRFSKDKSPYKTNISMMFWHGSGKKMQHPGMGMQIIPGETGLMAGMFNFPKPLLEAYRETLDSKQGARIEDAVAQVREAGYTLDGEQYKKVPRGYDADHPRGDLLKYKGLWVHASLDDAALLQTPEFVDFCYENFQKMSPVYLCLCEIQDRMTSPE